jgi:hypothetical protein
VSPRRNTPDPWPWPADTPLDRARRIASEFRDALSTRDPEEAARMEDRAVALGQGWIKPKVVQFEDDELLTFQEAADYCSVRPRTVDMWRSRGLEVVQTPDGLRVTPRALQDYQRERRLRRGRVA